MSFDGWSGEPDELNLKEGTIAGFTLNWDEVDRLMQEGMSFGAAMYEIGATHAGNRETRSGEVIGYTTYCHRPEVNPRFT